MSNDFKVDLSFNFYDSMMLSAMIAHARRYGDNQLSDWANELRDRMNKAAGFTMPVTEIPNPLKDVSPETAAKVAVEATQILDQLPPKAEAPKVNAKQAAPSKK